MPPIDTRAATQSPASFLPLLHPAWGWPMPPQLPGAQHATPWPAGADQASAEKSLIPTEPDALNERPSAETEMPTPATGSRRSSDSQQAATVETTERAAAVSFASVSADCPSESPALERKGSPRKSVRAARARRKSRSTAKARTAKRESLAVRAPSDPVPSSNGAAPKKAEALEEHQSSAATGFFHRLQATKAPKKSPRSCGTAKPSSDQSAPRRHRRRVGSLIVSTSLHGLALVVLAMVFVVREAEPEPLMISAGIATEQPLESPAEIEIATLEPLQPMPDEPVEPIVPDLADLEPLGPPLESLASAGELPAMETVSLVDEGLLSGPVTADLLTPVGSSETGRGGGGRGAGLTGGGTLFFGTPGAGTSICFMCDNSRSYDEGGFERVVGELMRSVASLKPEQSFFVVFFSDEAYPMFSPDAASSMMPATDENKRRLHSWLGSVEKRTGGQGLRDAMEIVESLQPASICFLSDGDHSESLVHRLVSADLGGAVVNTFGMQTLPARRSSLTPQRLQEQQQFNQNLIDIATAHGGIFTPVVVRP